MDQPECSLSRGLGSKGMEVQTEALKFLTKGLTDAHGVVFVLETEHEVIGVPEKRDFSPDARFDGLFHPQIQHFMEVHIARSGLITDPCATPCLDGNSRPSSKTPA